ncbi:MAG: sel1 repeat family protein [Nitrosospira sp.]|nr:sel1 repeat family protein [Nitrosospira sp.]
MIGEVLADPLFDAQQAYLTGDYVKAKEIILPLAEEGNVLAQYNLAVIHISTPDSIKNYQEAMKWFHLASLQGDADAQVWLGVMYDQGQGVIQDYQEAIKWYRLAAEHGNSNAQASLGIMYGEGQGVSKDDIRAYMWLDLAASQGVNLAEHGRNLLAEKMTISQINEAQKKTMNCKNSDYKNCD